MAEIDKLEIKISTNATAATNRINKLIASLEKLKGIGALDNLIDTASKLDVVMKPLASSVNGMNRAMTKSARGTAKAIEQGKAAAEKMEESTARVTAEVEEQTGAAQKLGEVTQESAVNTESALSRIVPILKTVGTYTASVAKQAVKIAAFPFTAIGKGLSSIGSKIGGILHQIMRMLKMRIYRLIAKQIIEGFTTGINNAYMWANAVGNRFAPSMDRLATAALYLKNSLGAMVMPLINAVAPAIDYIIDKFVDLLNVANRLFALLTGASTWTKAIKYPQAFAESANDATGAAQALEQEIITILGLDEINPLNGANDTGRGRGSAGSIADDYSSMFQEVEVASESLGAFFDPIKKAWDNVGSKTLKSMQSAFDKCKSAAEAVGNSFWTVWQNGTGQQTIEHLLTILSNIFDFVGNIAAAFERGWNLNGNGTKIIQSLWNILNDVLLMFNKITAATAQWAAGLNLGPIITSFKNLLVPIEKLAKYITGAISWAWENIVLPMAKWGLENGLPAVLDAIASALTVIGDVIGRLQPPLKWLWDNIISPLAKTGSALVSMLKDVKTTLDKIHEFLQGIADIINGDLNSGLQRIKSALGVNGGKSAQSSLGKSIDTALRAAFPGYGYIADMLGLGTATLDFTASITGVDDNIPKNKKILSQFISELFTFKPNFTGEAKDRKLTGFTGILNWFSTLFQGKSANREISNFRSIFTSWSNLYSGTYKQLQVSGFMNIFNTWKTSFQGASANKTIGGFTAKIVDAIINILDMLIPGFKARVDSFKDNLPNKVLNGFVIGVDGIKTDGVTYKRMASGGAYTNGSWHDIPQYATGTLNAGSMFVAGEAGPELVGHVGSRTEVLNQSQLAATMAASMAQANAGQNQLLSALLGVAEQIAQNQGNGVTVSTSELVGGLQRMNRRDGRVVVATGG